MASSNLPRWQQKLNKGWQYIQSMVHIWREVTAGKRRVWTSTLGIGFSLAFLWLLLREVDLVALVAFVATSKLWWVVLGALVNLLNLWFRAIRWQTLLRTAKVLSVGDVFSALMIGFAINNTLPARLGELFKIYILADKHSLSKMTILATVATERLFDMLMLLILVLVSLMSGYSQQAMWMQTAAIYLAFLCLGIVGFLLVVWHKATELVSWLNTRLGPVRKQKYGRLLNGLQAFSAGLDGMAREKVSVFAIMGYSLLIWLSMLANVFFIVKAFSLDLPFSASLLTLVAQSLGMLIPSGPASIGTYEFMTIVSLGLFAVDQTKALGFSLVLHATRFLPTTIIGFVFLFQWFYQRLQPANTGLAEAGATNLSNHKKGKGVS